MRKEAENAMLGPTATLPLCLAVPCLALPGLAAACVAMPWLSWLDHAMPDARQYITVDTREVPN